MVSLQNMVSKRSQTLYDSETLEKTNLIWTQREDDLLEREMVYFRLMKMLCIFIDVVITGYVCETYRTVRLK